jgi:heat shock protein HslJ
VYANGNATDARMGGQPVSVQREVPPGQEYDIELNLVAPQKTGTYVAYWQMENDKGQAFGERLPVAITVVLAPTATPSPGINFSVDRTQIKAGECVVFEWSVENVSEVFFYPEGERWQDNGVSGQGSQRECPAETTTFDLRVVKLDESVETRQITVNVEAAAQPPIISQFRAVPPGPIEQGDCVNITWETGGSIDRVTIWSNDFTLWEGAPLQGSLQDCPAGPGTVTYRLEAEGPGGSNGRQQSVDILGPPTETPVATPTATPVSTPTPGPAEPVIDAFTVEPQEIEAGDCVSIAWSTSGGTSWVTITADDVILQDNAPLEGNLEHCPQAPGSVEYEIISYNDQDQTTKQQQRVTVTGGEGPANPLAGTSWLATAYYDPGANGMVSVLPGTSLTAEFDREDSLVGSGGCNDYRARYQVEGSNLAIEGVSAGRTLCSEPEGIMEQEAQFLGHLEAATTFTLEGNQVRIAGSAGQTLLEFAQP